MLYSNIYILVYMPTNKAYKDSAGWISKKEYWSPGWCQRGTVRAVFAEQPENNHENNPQISESTAILLHASVTYKETFNSTVKLL
jgi:hypothetical protein